MKNKVIWLGLSLLIAVTMIMTSCSTSSSTTGAKTTTNTTAAATGKWWTKLGTPQYGGEINLRIDKNFTSFDPYLGQGPIAAFTGWIEQLFYPDWTMDPAVQSYQLSFTDQLVR